MKPPYPPGLGNERSDSDSPGLDDAPTDGDNEEDPLYLPGALDEDAHKTELSENSVAKAMALVEERQFADAHLSAVRRTADAAETNESTLQEILTTLRILTLTVGGMGMLIVVVAVVHTVVDLLGP